MAWVVERHREDAATFHARPVPSPARREVWICEPTAGALVLGSAQRDEVVDRRACAETGVEVVRRRSGGGAVLVEPGSVLWVDVLLPTGDPLWVPDVGHAFLWLGGVWAAALAELGVDTAIHRGGLHRTAWSDLVCFAGLGPGELTDPAGRKVLGISQRRTRAAVRFQCAALGTWDAASLIRLLELPAADRVAAGRDLRDVAAGTGVDLDALLAAFLRHLP